MKSITILTLALALAACTRHDTPTPIATAVELAPVREESRGSATRYSATVEPDAQVAVAFRVSGYVDAITVEEGDRVAKGTMLARIRTADYEQKLGQATASQAEARAALAQAKSDLARAEALFAANAMTRPELDAAIANVDVDQARLERGAPLPEKRDWRCATPRSSHRSTAWSLAATSSAATSGSPAPPRSSSPTPAR